MPDTFWVVGLMRRWENLDMAPEGWPEGMPSPFGMAPAVDGGCVGFLPVFATEEAAREFAKTDDGTFAVFRIQGLGSEPAPAREENDTAHSGGDNPMRI